MATRTRLTVNVTEETPGQLNTVARVWRDHDRAWLAEQRQALPVYPRREAREAAAALRVEHARLRAEGALLGSATDLVAHHARAVLAARDLTGDYEPLPAGARTRGRPFGRGPLYPGSYTELKTKMSFDLDASLAEQLIRAAYWTSADAVTELERWSDRFGPGPAIGGPAGALALIANAIGGPRATDMTEREKLRRQIITVGDLLREAIDAAIDAPTPPPLPEPAA